MKWNFKYFKRSEFACKCCGELPEIAEEHYYYMVFYFLEQFRKELGRPIIIRSGYRCPKHNLEVGGVVRSYHTIPKNPTFRHPCAVDMYSECFSADNFSFWLGLAINLDYCGYHLYINDKGLYFVHLDFRGRYARW